MAGLIKSADPATLGRVPLAALRPPEPPRPSAVEVERDDLVERIEALSAELERRDRRIATLEADAADVFAKGEAEGRAQGLEEGAERAREALALLSEGIDEALGQARREMAALDRLAVELARTALAKLIGDDAGRADFLAKLVREQLRNLEADAVLGIEVSTHDFGAQDGLEALAAAVRKPAAAIRARADFPTGACRIRLTLGGLEVGLDQQWRRLDGLFDELTEQGLAA